MNLPLTIDHLLWRMDHVHHASEVVTVSGGRVLTSSFADTAASARRLAAGLEACYGLGRGSVVAMLAFNTRQHLEVVLGVPTIGATVESINIRATGDMILDQIRRSRPDLVIIDEEALEHPAAGPVVHTVLRDCREGDPPVLIVDSRRDAGLDDVMTAGGAGAPATAPDGEYDTAYLFHTSGTTGPPKTYPVTHRDAVLHALSQATTAASGLTAADRVLPLAPFFHVNGWGLPLTCAVTGTDLVLTGAEMAPDSLLDVLEQQRITVAAGVPTIWHDVCEAAQSRRPDAHDGSPATPALREVLSGGSAVPASIARAVEDLLGARVTAAWGMTETMACSTYERDDPGSAAGWPIPLVETRVINDVPVRHGCRGRLQVRGPFIIGTRADGEGWVDTGDIASLDIDGRLRLHDREKDLIKSGGEWIASAELEQELCSHPAVSAAAVIARADPRWMERPVAYVVPRDGIPRDAVSEDVLRQHLAGRFPKWWLPDVIVVTDDLPTTAVGKLDKAALRRAQTAPVTTHTETGIPNSEVRT